MLFATFILHPLVLLYVNLTILRKYSKACESKESPKKLLSFISNSVIYKLSTAFTFPLEVFEMPMGFLVYSYTISEIVYIFLLKAILFEHLYYPRTNTLPEI